MKKRLVLMMTMVMMLLCVFAPTALASDDDEVTITGTIHEADGTPAEKGTYVISITTDKLVCVSGTDGFITLIPQFMDDTHVITVKKDNVEVATADINLTHGDAYSFTATEAGADIVVPVDMTEIQFDIIVNGDALTIEEPAAETAATNSGSQKSGGSALVYILIAVVVIVVVVVIIAIGKKKKKA